MLRLKVRRQTLREVGKAFAVGFMAAAVLWLIGGYPAVSQGPRPPELPPLPDRSQIVSGLEQTLGAVLTAASDVVYDPERAVLFSTPKVTGAFIPLSKGDFERTEEILAGMLRGEKGSAPLGAFWLGEALALGPDLTLQPGVYTLVAESADSAAIINEEGIRVGSVPIKVTQVPNTTPTMEFPEVTTNQKGFQITYGPNCIEACIIILIAIAVASPD